MNHVNEMQVQLALDNNLFSDLQNQLRQIEKNLSLTIGTININSSQLEQLTKSITITPTLDVKRFYEDAKTITDTLEAITNRPNTNQSSLPAIQNLVGGIGIAVTAFTAITSIIDAYNQKQEIARQNAIAYAKETNNQIQALGELRNAYMDIVDGNQTELLKTQELEYWKRQLVAAYGLEKEALQDINLERQNSLEILDTLIAKQQLQKSINALVQLDGYKDAVKAMENPGENTYHFSEKYPIPISDDIIKKLKENNIELKGQMEDIDGQFKYTLYLANENVDSRINRISSLIQYLNDQNEPLYAADKELQEILQLFLDSANKIKDKYGDTYDLGNEETANRYFLEFILEYNGSPIDFESLRQKIDSLDIGEEAKNTALVMVAELEFQYTESQEEQAQSYINNITESIALIKELERILENLQANGTVDYDSFQTLLNLFPEASQDLIQNASGYEQLISFINTEIQKAKEIGQEAFTSLSETNEDTVGDIIGEHANMPGQLDQSYQADYDNFAGHAYNKYLVAKKYTDMILSLWAGVNPPDGTGNTQKTNFLINGPSQNLLNSAMNIVQSAGAKKPSPDTNGFNELLNMNSITTSTDPPPYSPSGGSRATASTKDTHKEAYDNELKELKYHLDAKLISEEEYLKQSMALNDKYFKDQEKYADLYRQNALKDSNSWEKLQEDKINKQIGYNDKMIKVLSEDPILNSAEIVALMREQEELQKQLYQTTFDQREHLLSIGFTETDKEILELNTKLLDIEQQMNKTSDSIYSHYNDVLKAEFTEIDASIDRHRENIAGLDTAYREFTDNQVDEKIANINTRMTEHSAVANQIADKIDLLNQRYQAGEISLEEYDKTLKSLNQDLRFPILPK